MNRPQAASADREHWGDPAAITLDAEFRDMVPLPAGDEKQSLEYVLFTEGCRDALMVWPCQGRLILLIGYAQFELLRLYRLPFRIVEKELATREEARRFIIRYHLARPHLSPLAVSYLRGMRYQAEKQPHGGDHQAAQSRASSLADGKTADALAEVLGVDPRTIRRDGVLAVAVNHIAAKCGAAVKPLLLGRQGPLTRTGLVDLAKLEPEAQQALVRAWRVTGKWPRGWRSGGRPATLTLPRAPQALAATLLLRLGLEEAEVVLQAFQEVITIARRASGKAPEATAPSSQVSRIAFCQDELTVSLHFMPHPSEWPDWSRRQALAVGDRLHHYHWDYQGGGLPWLEDRLYRNGPQVEWDTTTHGSVRPHGLKNPAPYHPALRHYKVYTTDLAWYEANGAGTLFRHHWEETEHRTGLPFVVRRPEDLFVTTLSPYARCDRFEGTIPHPWNLGDEYRPDATKGLKPLRPS